MKLKNYLKLFNISNIDFSKKIGVSNVSLSRYIKERDFPRGGYWVKFSTNHSVWCKRFLSWKNSNSELNDHQKEELNNMVNSLRKGKLKFIAKAITLIESSLKLHKLQASFYYQS